MINRNEIPFPYLRQTRRKENQTSSASKYPQGFFKDKPCKYCKTEFTPTAPSEHYCSDYCKDWGTGSAYLRRTYGIDVEDYKDLYIKQNGKCAICNEDGYVMNALHHVVQLNVDHCHTSNEVRGLLCHDCNRGLGLFKDKLSNLQSAIIYLSKESATTIPNGSTSEANADGSGSHPHTGDDIV